MAPRALSSVVEDVAMVLKECLVGAHHQEAYDVVADASEPVHVSLSQVGCKCQADFPWWDCGGNPGPERDREGSRMCSYEQRRLAMETFIKLDHGCADTIAELGYPTAHALRGRWKGYGRTREVPAGRSETSPRYADGQRRTAVGHHLGHGKGLAGTMGALGYPKGREILGERVGGIAPGRRRHRGPNPRKDAVPIEKEVKVVAELEARTGPAAKAAGRHGVSGTAPYVRRGEVMGGNGGEPEGRGVPVGKGSDGPPDDVEQLQDMLREAKTQLRKVQLELDVRQATLEIAEKDPGADPDRLANAEKAAMVTAPRARHGLCEPLPAAGMAESSCGYAGNAQLEGEAEERAAAKEAAAEALGPSGGTCGCRRIVAGIDAGSEPGGRVGEWAVRAIMAEEDSAACAAKEKRRCSPYGGETSAAPPDLLPGGRGRRRFRAGGPDEEWITDVAESRIPAGRACLPPIVDCFDGMPPGRSISTSPDAETANPSLLGAVERLGGGGRPVIRNGRGGHCRWPGWIRICGGNGPARPMPGKGCSPGNARCGASSEESR